MVEAAKKILVADRNRHVREFLRRELAGEGYEILVARDGREVRELLDSPTPLDLIILDPEVPFLEALTDAGSLRSSRPEVPLIIHFFGGDQPPGAVMGGVVACLEKTADPARLKQVVAEVLQKGNPEHPGEVSRDRPAS